MPRRSVSFPVGLDQAVRGVQTVMMREQNRDISFTEVLVGVVMRGLLAPGPDGKTIATWIDGKPEASGEDFFKVLEGFDPDKLKFEGWLDSFPTVEKALGE